MSAFASKNFKSDNYALFRPTYPDGFWLTLDNYHAGSKSLAVDCGCGPGEATFPLLRKLNFEQVLGTDFSRTMVEKAREHIGEEEKGRISFEQRDAGNLEGVAAGSVDMMTSAESAHWFDAEAWLKEALRVLKPGGTLAYWGYVDPYFLGSPEADEIYHDLTYGSDSLGPYWEQPGRSILCNLYEDVTKQLRKMPGFTDIEVVHYDAVKHPEQHSALSFEKTVTLRNYLEYGKTWSSYHKWTEAHPNAEQDIMDVFAQRLDRRLGWQLDTKIRISWKTMYCFARRIK